MKINKKQMSKKEGFIYEYFLLSMMAILVVGGVFSVSKKEVSDPIDPVLISQAVIKNRQKPEVTKLEIKASTDAGIREEVLAVDEEGEMVSATAKGETITAPANAQEGTAELEAEAMAESYSALRLGGRQMPVLAFYREDYEKALTLRKLVILYYWDKNCAPCAIEKEKEFRRIIDAANVLDSKEAIIFLVEYDSDKPKLLSEGNITADLHAIESKNAKVFLVEGEVAIRAKESWTTDKIISEISRLLR